MLTFLNVLFSALNFIAALVVVFVPYFMSKQYVTATMLDDDHYLKPNTYLMVLYTLVIFGALAFVAAFSYAAVARTPRYVDDFWYCLQMNILFLLLYVLLNLFSTAKIFVKFAEYRPLIRLVLLAGHYLSFLAVFSQQDARISGLILILSATLIWCWQFIRFFRGKDMYV